MVAESTGITTSKLSSASLSDKFLGEDFWLLNVGIRSGFERDSRLVVKLGDLDLGTAVVKNQVRVIDTTGQVLGIRRGHQSANAQSQVSFRLVADDLTACHGRVHHELALKGVVLDQDRRVVHGPLAVLGIINLRHFKLVCKLPVIASVEDGKDSLRVWPLFLKDCHEESICREVEPFWRKKFWRLDARHRSLLSECPHRGTQLHLGEKKDLT